MSFPQINAYTLLSTCILAAENAAVKIREVHHNRTRGSIPHKPPTQAIAYDAMLASQTEIYSIFNDKIAGIQIITESDLPHDCFAVSYQDRVTTLIPQKFSVLLNEYLDLEYIQVFVNPLDTIASFVNDSLSTVTLMIGVLYRNQPLIGLIMHPFVTPLEPIFAVKDIGENIPSLLRVPYEQTQGLARVIVPQDYRINVPDYEIFNARGSGYKFSSLFTGYVDIVAFRKAQLRTWDILPGFVIIEALGGKIICDRSKHFNHMNVWDSFTGSLTCDIEDLPF